MITVYKWFIERQIVLNHLLELYALNYMENSMSFISNSDTNGTEIK